VGDTIASIICRKSENGGGAGALFKRAFSRLQDANHQPDDTSTIPPRAASIAI